MGRRFVRKLFLAVTSMALALTLVGGAYALTGESDEEQTPTVEQAETGDSEPLEEETETSEPEEEETDDGVHGGSVARIHEGCDGVEGLEGNWTHGDYVSAVGAQSGPEAKKAAAKSDCGKPDKGKRARGDDEAGDDDAKGQKKAGQKANKGGKHGGDSGGDDDGSGEDETVTE